MFEAWRKKAVIGTLAAVLLGSASIMSWAGTSERIVQDRHSGLAIHGIDPVSYFVDGQPELGSAKYELTQSGTVWRFLNAGNLATFKERPDVYGPQFGGYDPVDAARGVPVAGKPSIWLIAGQRLFLFVNDENREAFVKNGASIVQRARDKWPEIVSTLAE